MANGVGSLIRAAREEAGLTQAELARRLSCKQPTVARLESPGANPTVKTLDRVVRATGQRLQLRAAPGLPEVDETMIAANLRLTPAERLAAFTASYRNMRDFLASVRSLEKPG